MSTKNPYAMVQSMSAAKFAQMIVCMIQAGRENQTAHEHEASNAHEFRRGAVAVLARQVQRFFLERYGDEEHEDDDNFAVELEVDFDRDAKERMRLVRNLMAVYGE